MRRKIGKMVGEATAMQLLHDARNFAPARGSSVKSWRKLVTGFREIVRSISRRLFAGGGRAAATGFEHQLAEPPVATRNGLASPPANRRACAFQNGALGGGGPIYLFGMGMDLGRKAHLELEREILITRDSKPVARLVRVSEDLAARPRWNRKGHALWQKQVSRGHRSSSDAALGRARAERALKK